MPTAAIHDSAAIRWVCQVTCLARWHVYVLRRRRLTKVLLGLYLAGFILVIGFNIAEYAALTGPSYTLPTSCPATPTVTQNANAGSGSGMFTAPPCIAGSPAERAEAQRFKQEAIANEQRLFSFPFVLTLGGSYVGYMGLLLLCILGSAHIGGEFSNGTLRTLVTRGLSRSQVFASETIALGLVAVVVVMGTEAVATIVGMSAVVALGIHPATISWAGWQEIFLYMLALLARLVAYVVIALFLTMLGRSTMVGIAGSLGYIVGESVIVPLLQALRGTFTGPANGLVTHLPAVLIGFDFTALTSSIAQHPLVFSQSSDGQELGGVVAALIIGVYCAITLCAGQSLLNRRDVLE